MALLTGNGECSGQAVKKAFKLGVKTEPAAGAFLELHPELSALFRDAARKYANSSTSVGQRAIRAAISCAVLVKSLGMEEEMYAMARLGRAGLTTREIVEIVRAGGAYFVFLAAVTRDRQLTEELLQHL